MAAMKVPRDPEDETSPLRTVDLGAAPAADADLIALTGVLGGRRYTVGVRALIGRDTEAQVQLAGDDVSRRHATITRTASGEFVLEDLGSRNGTFVNGRPVEVHVLHFGDTIQVGLTTLFVFTHHQQALEEQLVRWQRMELIAQMTGGLVHDFRNYMTAILGYIQYLQEVARRETSIEDLRSTLLESVAVMESAAWEGVNLTRRVLSFAKGADRPREPVHLCEVAEEAIRLLERSFPKEVSFVTDVPRGLRVIGSRTELLQILVNLYLNARDAMPEGGAIRTEASLCREEEREDEGAGAGEVLLKVSDTGIGMDAETQRRAFEPLFTTKPAGKGTGLGLSTVARLIENHRGHVHVDSAPGAGTSFLIFLPAVEVPVSTAAAETIDLGQGFRPEDLLKVGTGFVLLVNDDDLVRQRTLRAVKPLQLQVLSAPSAAVAIDLYERYQSRIKLVVLDLDVTGPQSEETYRRLHRINPDVRVLVASNGNIARAGAPFIPAGRTVEWRADSETIARTLIDALRR
jgi:signal transduction histidine kinase/CheY-like chemotaxis protein